MAMKIEITDNKTIAALKEEFHAMFPYLKMEVFIKPQPSNGISAKDMIRYSDSTIAQFRTMHNNGYISITPQTTVAELEQTFRKQYGLSVQVFRRSGSVWLETTVTDSWTLQEQNEQGETLTRYIDGRNRGDIGPIEDAPETDD